MILAGTSVICNATVPSHGMKRPKPAHGTCHHRQVKKMADAFLNKIIKELSPMRGTLQTLICRAPDEQKASWHQQAVEIVENIISSTHAMNPDHTVDEQAEVAFQNLLRGLYQKTYHL